MIGYPVYSIGFGDVLLLSFDFSRGDVSILTDAFCLIEYKVQQKEY